MNFNKHTGEMLYFAAFVLLTWWFYRVAIMPKPRPTPIGVVAPAPPTTIATPWLLLGGIAALNAGRHFSEK